MNPSLSVGDLKLGDSARVRDVGVGFECARHHEFAYHRRPARAHPDGADAALHVLLRTPDHLYGLCRAELKLSVGLVEDMLAYWQRHGAVEQVSVGAQKTCGSSCSSGRCGSCNNAPASLVQTYRQFKKYAGKAHRHHYSNITPSLFGNPQLSPSPWWAITYNLLSP